MKRIAILGCTGSIGTNALEIIAQFPDRFQVAALAAGSNLEKLEKLIRRFHPVLASVTDPEAARRLQERVPPGTRVLSGMDGLKAVATCGEADLVVSALAGSIGLLPTFAAIEARKPLAIANKEPLVMAGEILVREAKTRGVPLMPIDSEHSAVFQSLAGHRQEDIRRIILTASGGPFLKTPPEALSRVTPESALNHPQWRMGKKVTIDSATLMNKGLEVIEARWLFDVPPARIEVHIHPQSIVHSMVEYIDGAVVAQMAAPDMRLPIAYALSYPERIAVKQPRLDLCQIGSLTFQRVDHERFPALGLAYRALTEGGTLPAVMNAANEVAVEAFLAGRLGFLQIAPLIEKTMDRHHWVRPHSLEEILCAHDWARKESQQIIDRGIH